jgi:hypothetical protein
VNWDEVQTKALKKGWLLFAMDQGQTDVVNTPGPWGKAGSGYCLGCTVRWIALRYGGSGYAFDPKTHVAGTADWRATRDQNIYEETMGSGDFPDELVAVYAQYGLTLNKGSAISQNSVATGSKLRAAGSAGKGCYHVVLTRDEGGRHGIAMQNEGEGKWRLFDANYGCFVAKSDTDFENLFGWYMDKTGYAKKFTVATDIIGINPPPYVNAAFASLVKQLIAAFGS